MAHLGNKVRRHACFDVGIKNVELIGLYHEKLLSKKKPPKIFVKFEFARSCTIYFENEFKEDKMILKPCDPELCSFYYNTHAAHLLKRQELKVSVFSPSNAFLSQLDSVLRRGEPFAVSESFGAVFDIGEIKPAVDLYTLATKTIKHELGLFNKESSCGRVKFDLVMTEFCPKATCVLDEVQLQGWQIPKTQHDADADEILNKKELKLSYFYVDPGLKQSSIEHHETRPNSASSSVPAWINFDLVRFHGTMPRMAKADIVIALLFVQAGIKTEIGRAKLPLSKYYSGDSDNPVAFEEEVIPNASTHAGTLREERRTWKISGCIKFANGPQFAQMTQGVHRETGVVNGFLVGISKYFTNPDDNSCDHPLPPAKIERQDSVVLHARAKKWRKRNEALKQELNEQKGICAKYSEDILNMTQQAKRDGPLKEKKRQRIELLKEQAAGLDERIRGLRNEVNSKPKQNILPLPPIDEPTGIEGEPGVPIHDAPKDVEMESAEPEDLPYLETAVDIKMGIPTLEPPSQIDNNKSVSEGSPNMDIEVKRDETYSKEKTPHTETEHQKHVSLAPNTNTSQKVHEEEKLEFENNPPKQQIDISERIPHIDTQMGVGFEDPSKRTQPAGEQQDVKKETGHKNRFEPSPHFSSIPVHQNDNDIEDNHKQQNHKHLSPAQSVSPRDLRWDWNTKEPAEERNDDAHKNERDEHISGDSAEEGDDIDPEFLEQIMINCRLDDEEHARSLIRKHKNAANVEGAIIDDIMGVFSGNRMDYLTAHLKHWER